MSLKISKNRQVGGVRQRLNVPRETSMLIRDLEGSGYSEYPLKKFEYHENSSWL